MAPPHVLLVEDSRFLSTQVSDRLATEYDFLITTVETAAAARDAVAQNDIDCVLVNNNLPDESGIAFAESVDQSLPIILLTATTLESVAADAVTAGVTEFIHKEHLAQGTMDVLANRIHVAIRAAETPASEIPPWTS